MTKKQPIIYSCLDTAFPDVVLFSAVAFDARDLADIVPGLPPVVRMHPSSSVCAGDIRTPTFDFIGSEGDAVRLLAALAGT